MCVVSTESPIVTGIKDITAGTVAGIALCITGHPVRECCLLLCVCVVWCRVRTTTRRTLCMLARTYTYTRVLDPNTRRKARYDQSQVTNTACAAESTVQWHDW